MGPSLCKYHGSRFFSLTSPFVRAAIHQRVAPPADRLRIVRIVEPGGTRDLIIDADFADEMSLLCDAEGLVVLHERDQVAHVLNDRVLLQRIRKRLERACPDCLFDVATGRIDAFPSKHQVATDEEIPNQPSSNLPLRCPCCGCKTLGERGGHELCEVCLWQDDGQDVVNASQVMGGPNRDLSLFQACIHYRRFGASRRQDHARAREPRAEEL